MATVAVGDIHGNLLALDDLLNKVLPTLARDDTLVFLGDYIDRGPDSRGCLERIIRLKQETESPVVTLLGNHEDWMLSSLHDYSSHSWILGMEALETIASYSSEAAAALRLELERAGMAFLVLEKPKLPYEIFFDLVPREHLTFLQNLELYYRSPDVICVHAGIDLDGSTLQTQPPSVYLWGPDGFPDLYRGKAPVVYGHWGNAVEDDSGWPRPCVRENRTYGIDTISRGVLTAMRFPDGKVFQSNRYSTERSVSEEV